MLDDRPDLDGAVRRGGDQARYPDRFAEIGEVGEEGAPDLLLRLGVAPVGDEALAVAHANDLRLRRGVELLAVPGGIDLRELAEGGLPTGHRLGAGRRRLLVAQ